MRYSADWFKSPLQVESVLRELWQSTAEAPSSAINWTEFTNWDIDATIDFRSGKTRRLVTDGGHSRTQGENGDIWFSALGLAGEAQQ
jgi:hypothetical protein